MAVSLRQVARQVGVSAGTVSRVLGNVREGVRISEARRDEIIAAAKTLHFRPNGDICVVLPATPCISQYRKQSSKKLNAGR